MKYDKYLNLNITNEDIINLKDRDDLVNNRSDILCAAIAYIRRYIAKEKREDVTLHLDYMIDALLKFKDAVLKYQKKANWRSYIYIIMVRRVVYVPVRQKHMAVTVSIDDIHESQIMEHETHSDILDTLKSLKGTESEVANLLYEGYNQKEIREILKINVANYKKILYILRERFKSI